MKSVYFFLAPLAFFVVGCSVVPKQKAGRDALAEAICLYDKQIDYGSDNFSECLQNEQK